MMGCSRSYVLYPDSELAGVADRGTGEPTP